MKCALPSSLALTWVLFLPLTVQATETHSFSYDVHGRAVASSQAGTVNNGVQTSTTYDASDNATVKSVTQQQGLMQQQSMTARAAGGARAAAPQPSGAALPASETDNSPPAESSANVTTTIP